MQWPLSNCLRQLFIYHPSSIRLVESELQQKRARLQQIRRQKQKKSCSWSGTALRWCWSVAVIRMTCFKSFWKFALWHLVYVGVRFLSCKSHNGTHRTQGAAQNEDRHSECLWVHKHWPNCRKPVSNVQYFFTRHQESLPGICSRSCLIIVDGVLAALLFCVFHTLLLG